MITRTRKMLLLGFLPAPALALALAVGCAHKNYVSRSEPVSMDASSSETGTGATLARQLVKTGNQRIKVHRLGEAVAKVDTIADQVGGFAERKQVSDDSAELWLRVPSGKLEETMKGISSVGREVEKSVNVEDVTKEMADGKARLENALALRNRLRELAKQAKDVKDILTIENELARVQTEIDQLQASLAALDAAVSMSSLHVRLGKERVLGPLGYLGYGVAWTIEKLFIIE